MDGNVVEIIVIVLTLLVGLLQPLVSKLLKKGGLNIPDVDDDEAATEGASEEASMRQATENPALEASMRQATEDPALEASMRQATDGPSLSESMSQATAYVPAGDASKQAANALSRTESMLRTTVDSPQMVTEQQAKPKARLAGNAYSVGEAARKREPLDKRKLIIYSEIMKPKFDDF